MMDVKPVQKVRNQNKMHEEDLHLLDTDEMRQGEVVITQESLET